MDKATVFGVAIGVLAILFAMVLKGGSLLKLLDPGAILLIVVGTFAATAASFSVSQLKEVGKITRQAFKEQQLDVAGVISTLVSFAEKARREGLLVLEDDAQKLEDKFLQKGIQLVVDGTDMELVRSILETELNFLEQRHKVGENMFMSAGGFAPTLGVLGAVIGLIVALGAGAADFEILASKIGIAFTAALYGIGLANLVFIPIGNKLRMRSNQEILLREVMIEGILSIQAGDNPRIVEEKLKAFMPPAIREQIKKKEAPARAA